MLLPPGLLTTRGYRLAAFKLWKHDPLTSTSGIRDGRVVARPYNPRRNCAIQES